MATRRRRPDRHPTPPAANSWTADGRLPAGSPSASFEVVPALPQHRPPQRFPLARSDRDAFLRKPLPVAAGRPACHQDSRLESSARLEVGRTVGRVWILSSRCFACDERLVGAGRAFRGCLCFVICLGRFRSLYATSWGWVPLLPACGWCVADRDVVGRLGLRDAPGHRRERSSHHLVRSLFVASLGCLRGDLPSRRRRIHRLANPPLPVSQFQDACGLLPRENRTGMSFRRACAVTSLLLWSPSCALAEDTTPTLPVDASSEFEFDASPTPAGYLRSCRRNLPDVSR